MLDTGIDVPEVVNLVFFKRVRSVTKFWQMIGRGTRLRSDIFGPGKDKKEFYVFDCCGNLEFFGQNPKGVEGKLAPSISEHVFRSRVELLVGLKPSDDEPLAAIPAAQDGTTSAEGPRRDVADTLTAGVQAMNPDNFFVRPQREWVERYSEREAWGALDDRTAPDVVEHLGNLPTAAADGDELAKRFDLTLLRLQLATLKGDVATDRLREQVQDIASGLLETVTIPEVAKQAALLAELAGDEWWVDATLPLLELARRRVRGLVQFLPKHKRLPIYTNFEDTLGELEVVDLGRPHVGVHPERFKEKAGAYLRQHEDHAALQKVRRGKHLTSTDLDELERMLVEAGVGTAGDVAAAAEAAGGLGVFIRSLVGLERSAVEEAFEEFLRGSAHSTDQINFVKMIVDHMTYSGVMKVEVPIHPRSPTTLPGAQTTSSTMPMSRRSCRLSERSATRRESMLRTPSDSASRGLCANRISLEIVAEKDDARLVHVRRLSPRCGKSTVGAADPQDQATWRADDLVAEVAELRARGVEILDLDLPEMGIATVDVIADAALKWSDRCVGRRLP